MEAHSGFGHRRRSHLGSPGGAVSGQVSGDATSSIGYYFSFKTTKNGRTPMFENPGLNMVFGVFLAEIVGVITGR